MTAKLGARGRHVRSGSVHCDRAALANHSAEPKLGLTFGLAEKCSPRFDSPAFAIIIDSRLDQFVFRATAISSHRFPNHRLLRQRVLAERLQGLE